MTPKTVYRPHGATPCPILSTVKTNNKPGKTNHTNSVWSYRRKHSLPKEETTQKTSFWTKLANAFNECLTPLLIFAGLKNAFNTNFNYAQPLTEDTKTPVAEKEEILTLGDETGAKAAQTDLDAMLNVKQNTPTFEADKTKALETIEKNKEEVKKYSDSLLALSKKEIATDFDTDHDGKISEEEFAKEFISADGKQEGVDAELQKQYITNSFAALNLNSTQGDKYIDTQEYASSKATIDTNSDGKIDKKEMDAFLNILSGDASNDELTKFQTRNVFLHGILFESDKFGK